MIAKLKNCSAVILAGGKATRIKKNKCLLKIKDKPLLEILIDKLDREFPEIIISVKTPEWVISTSPRIRIIKDRYRKFAPLAGIYSSLMQSKNRYCFVVACDMPFIDMRLVRYMAKYTGGYDVIMPQSRKGLEPLMAFYSKDCLGHIKRHLKKGELKVIELLKYVKAKIIPTQNFGWLNQLSFFNINSPADYRKAIKLACKS